MSKMKCSESEFIKLFLANGAAETARIIGCDVRNVHYRRRAIEQRNQIVMQSGQMFIPENRKRIEFSIDNGVILVGSDAHYWPGSESVAHAAFIELCKRLKPKLVVANGDMFDGASISRHDRIGWSKGPNVKDELDAVRTRMGEIEKAAKGAKRVWTYGNHDMRFESRLSANIPEFEGIGGLKLKDHFPMWTFGTSLMVNGDVMIKHRWHQSIHNTYQNTLKAGCSMVTGHCHRLQVTMFTDYNGTRYGVDTGTMCDTNGPQMDYAEDTPGQRSGFAVLTFVDGKLLYPEVCFVDNGRAYFRGELVCG